MTIGLSSIGGDAKAFFSSPFGIGTIGAGVIGAGAVAVNRVRRKRKKTKTVCKRVVTRKRKTGRKLKFGSKAWRKKYIKKKPKKRPIKYARTAGKRKDRSTRRIRMTKNGQPYIILANGRARFIKKSSARRSRKLKGGRY